MVDVLAKREDHLVRQDWMIALQTEAIRLAQVMLGKMNERRDHQHQMLSTMDDNIERMRQPTVRITHMLADPARSFDRLRETADRRVQRMERAP